MNKILDIYNSFFINNEKTNFNVIFNNKVNLNYIENFIKSNNLDNNILYRLNSNVKSDFYYIVDDLENLDNTFFLIHFVKNDHVTISYTSEYIGMDIDGFSKYDRNYYYINYNNNNNNNIYYIQILCFILDNTSISKIDILYKFVNECNTQVRIYNYKEFEKNIIIKKRNNIKEKTHNSILRKIKLFLFDLCY